MARYPFVHVKVTMDGTLHGVRVVLATVVPNAHEATVETVQERLDRARGADPEHGPQFAGIRRGTARTARGDARFRRAVGNLATACSTGTVAVTSLGHRDVDGFHSVGGTTVTIGVGRIVPRPVVRDGRVVVAPVLRLSLTFDHRVIDGAEAADVLTEVKQELETGA